MSAPGESAEGVVGGFDRASTAMFDEGVEGVALIWTFRIWTRLVHEDLHLDMGSPDLPTACSRVRRIAVELLGGVGCLRSF